MYMYRRSVWAMLAPLKSPTVTSTQVAAVLHWAHIRVVKEVPVEIPVHHEPPCKYRPVMSSMPLPLKSPTLTSTQVAAVLHAAHMEVEKEEPVLKAVHHEPPCK